MAAPQTLADDACPEPVAVPGLAGFAEVTLQRTFAEPARDRVRQRGVELCEILDAAPRAHVAPEAYLAVVDQTGRGARRPAEIPCLEVGVVDPASVEGPDQGRQAVRHLFAFVRGGPAEVVFDESAERFARVLHHQPATDPGDAPSRCDAAGFEPASRYPGAPCAPRRRVLLDDPGTPALHASILGVFDRRRFGVLVERPE